MTVCVCDCFFAARLSDLSVPDHVEHPVLGADHGSDRRGPLPVHLSPVAERPADESVPRQAGRDVTGSVCRADRHLCGAHVRRLQTHLHAA